ncbi:MAG: hypothetical protein HUU35_16260 [Armatimonadetes bacterium]|nr:hypothetical protein [Armatimonadota bacterium]
MGGRPLAGLPGCGSRRHLTAFEDHCASCPGKARLYANVEAMVEETGGWPGDGSDDCHGNCLCSLEPATEFSVFGDETEGLLTPEGPPWVPPADRGPDGGGAAGGPPVPPPPGGSDDDEPPLDDDELARRVAEELVPLLDSGVEHLVILDRRGRVLARAEGDETSVRLPEGDWSGCVVGHTHPDGLDGMNWDDLLVSARNSVYLACVVYRWGGRAYVQVLSSPSGEWPAADELCDELLRERNEVMGERRRREIPSNVGPMHQALERIAVRYRLAYHQFEV